MKRVAARGWTAPAWPTQYGGGGLAPDKARWSSRSWPGSARRWSRSGSGCWVPCCWSSPTRRRRPSTAEDHPGRDPLVPGLFRARRRLRPGLAADQLRGGRPWLINGQKIWTSYANKADWCFCLVRTDPTAKKQGISFVLIDMATPGVETRPIKLISGESPFCDDLLHRREDSQGQPGRPDQRAGKSPSACCSTSARTSPAASAAVAAPAARRVTWAISPSAISGPTDPSGRRDLQARHPPAQTMDFGPWARPSPGHQRKPAPATALGRHLDHQVRRVPHSPRSAPS